MNKGFYLESLRKNKNITILMVAISVIINFLILFGYSDNEWTRSYHYSEFTGIMFLVAMLTVYLCTTQNFSFLNKRNACDVYHSLPVTRGQMFWSIIASVGVNALLIILVNVGSLFLFSSILPGIRVTCEGMQVAKSVLYLICVCIYCVGIVALAHSVSGTGLTNLAVMAMLVVVPVALRIYFLWLCQIQTILCTEASINVPVISYLNGGEQLSVMQMSLQTLFEGCLYLVLAFVCFKKRKSEASNMPASLPCLQYVFRLMPAFVISLYGVYSIVDYITRRKYGAVWSEYEKRMCIIVFIIAVVVYFLYEMITVRKWSAIRKSLKGLIGLLVLDLLIGVAGIASHDWTMNYIPTNASYVRLCGPNEFKSSTDYYVNCVRDIKIDNPEVIAILEEALTENHEDIKADGFLNRNGSRILVEFHKGLITYNRFVFLTDEQVRRLDAEQVIPSQYEALRAIDVQRTQMFVQGDPVSDEVKNVVWEAYLTCLEKTPAQRISGYYGIRTPESYPLPWWICLQLENGDRILIDTVYDAEAWASIINTLNKARYTSPQALLDYENGGAWAEVAAIDGTYVKGEYLNLSEYLKDGIPEVKPEEVTMGSGYLRIYTQYSPQDLIYFLTEEEISTMYSEY